MKNWRWVNWLYALVAGYFWMPCRMCGRMYGGHEECGTLMLSYSSGICVCQNCAAKAQEKNLELLSSLPPMVIL
jgi:hypothetical protein